MVARALGPGPAGDPVDQRADRLLGRRPPDRRPPGDRASTCSKRAQARKITTITYGAHAVDDAPTAPVTDRGLEPGRYLTLIARPIPENSILELSRASRRARAACGSRCWATLGHDDPYHQAVRAAASDEVELPRADLRPETVRALRFHSVGYLHGHTVGGTNPSLVEALAAGNPVLAHDNEYNRWVAGDAALYFTDGGRRRRGSSTRLLDDPSAARPSSASAARTRHAEEFTWEHVAGQYEDLLEQHLPATARQEVAA